MLFDVLDVLCPMPQYTAEGTFWKTKPDKPGAHGGARFNYEYVDPASRSYRRLFGNIQAFDAGETAIRTNDLFPWSAKGYFMTADESLYRITEAREDFSAAPKQAMRLQGTPLGTEWVVRGVRIDNPWGAR